MCCFEKKHGHPHGPGAGTDLWAAWEGHSLSFLSFPTWGWCDFTDGSWTVPKKPTEGVAPTQGQWATASGAADAKNPHGLRGKTDTSWDKKPPGDTEYLEMMSGLESPRAGNTLSVGEHWRDVQAVLFLALTQTHPFTWLTFSSLLSGSAQLCVPRTRASCKPPNYWCLFF